MGWGPSAGKTCHSEIEAAPEEMHRAYFADETTAEELQDPIRLQQRTPEALRRSGIVMGVRVIQREADRIQQLARQLVYRDSDAQLGQQLHKAPEKLGDALRSER